LFGDEIENIEHTRNKVDASLFAFFFYLKKDLGLGLRVGCASRMRGEALGVKLSTFNVALIPADSIEDKI
jgi:hypothetical protein